MIILNCKRAASFLSDLTTAYVSDACVCGQVNPGFYENPRVSSGGCDYLLAFPSERDKEVLGHLLRVTLFLRNGLKPCVIGADSATRNIATDLCGHSWYLPLSVDAGFLFTNGIKLEHGKDKVGLTIFQGFGKRPLKFFV
ncbi:hypothetical protein NPIL_482951 [Nephila pilipes]|uniref:Uncharacterized protein n=1 Tax=Nephila pilipes TaxID=299642 RepID=A0A8X6QB29_NEPPI|nr:hypothetical protein NPIL_482951 [Nephila pilipes]